MICFPNIKINLGLHVINRRTDGFHNIESVFVPVNCCDVLEIIEATPATKGEIYFSSSGLLVEGHTDDNLVVKAYKLLHELFHLPSVVVHLHKKIPMGAGLGGGSSDAAWMIRLLNEKFVLGLTVEQMEQHAAKLGSDCAFFIRNKTAYVWGKGHELEPYHLDLTGYYLVLLYAGVHSNTALAYSQVSPRGEFSAQKSLKELLKLPAENWKDDVVNDFERGVFGKFPELASLKQELYTSGAIYASMSGSGSALFALYTKRPQLSDQLRSVVCYEGWISS